MAEEGAAMDEGPVTLIQTSRLFESNKAPSESFMDYVPHHNVASFRRCANFDGKDGNDCHGATFHRENLEDFLSKYAKKGVYLRDEYRKTILLQIAHGLRHLHELKITHGCLNEKTILFPFDIENKYCRTAANAVITVDGNDVENSHSRDIVQLATVFEFVLTNGDREETTRGLICRDHFIAQDLLNKMKEDMNFTIDKVLAHPFFWSDEKKITFISRCHEYLNAKNESGHLDENKNLGDWSSILKLDEWESSRCIDKYHPETPSENVVVRRAKKKHQERNRHKVSELLRFFRNTREHFYEQDQLLRWAFLEDDTTQYWLFFSRRFPTLFFHIWGVTKSVDNGKFFLGDSVKQNYLEKIRENESLPNSQLHECSKDQYIKESMPHPDFITI